MADSNSSEGEPLGMKQFAVPRVPVKLAASVTSRLGTAAVTLRTSGVASSRPRPKPDATGEGAPSSVLDTTVIPKVTESVVKPKPVPVPVPAPTVVPRAQPTVRMPRVKHIADPPPTDAPRIEETQFRSEEVRAIRQSLGGPTVPEAKPTKSLYRPITSGAFQDFIITTYRQYSALATAAFEEGERVLDKDACKKRDPNKVETFYYQKFVRDYLSRDTPYRGLLVYHGLGTGKTCTSIAAAEALYWGGRKTIWILTPATLSSNYRREISKCGYFPLRYNNFWQFMEAKPDSPPFIWLRDILGLPVALIEQQGGGWVPNPNKPANWDTLSAENKQSIRNQIQLHLQHRFKFIHYNGVRKSVLSQMAYEKMLQNTSLFDDSVVVIDEIHNLARTIDGTMVVSKTISQFMAEEEPPEFNWTMKSSRELPEELQGKYEYPRGYTFYRLLQNAVNAKIIALSATPMINYAQEFAVLMNIVGGDQRTVEISLKDVDTSVAGQKRITEWAKRHPEIDYFAIETVAVQSATSTVSSREYVLTLTPVPHGFTKVVDAKADYTMRGFVRKMPGTIGPASMSNERNMDGWGARMVAELEKAGIFTAGTAAAVAEAVATSRSAGPGPGAPLESTRLRTKTYQLLPDDEDVFVQNFIDRATLRINHPNVLKARATGLISYYKGGSEELMPRAESTIERVEMSPYMFSKYVEARLTEMDLDKKVSKQKPDAGTAKPKVAKRGMTAFEMDLYAQATSKQSAGFMTLSRAACNFVFPEDVERPDPKQKMKLLGIEREGVIAADLHVDYDPELNVTKAGGVSSAVGDATGSTAVAAVGEGGEEGAGVVVALADEPDAEAAAVAGPQEDAISRLVGSLMAQIEKDAGKYLSGDALKEYSPKYAAIMERIRTSPGPALVYSQFKTLEGLGLFAAALRVSAERYVPLDIQKGADGEWAIPDAVMDPARPRYILYTGDQDLEKRRLLLQLYNADVAGLPPKLSAQCSALLAGAPDNRDGRICRIFMITQSGAEGISLFNTRQVHIMEPYWNNVRLQQVIGRAIRLCSHMNLPWEDRVVNVYTYLSVFTAAQKSDGDGRKVIMEDGGMTTDEQIYDIALKKQQLADGLFEIAQSSATDCALHYDEQSKGTGVQCFEYPEGQRPMFLYHPDYEQDIAATGSAAGKKAKATGTAAARKTVKKTTGTATPSTKRATTRKATATGV